jgi:hypothetical protein
MVRVHQNNKTIKLKVLDTELLQSLIRTPQRKKWMLKDTYTETQEKDAEQQCLPVTRPSCSSTYMASAFGLIKEF